MALAKLEAGTTATVDLAMAAALVMVVSEED